LYAAADAAWLGGLTERTVALLDDARRHAAAPNLVMWIDHLRGHIATRRGPVQVGQAILLEAAHRAAAIDPDRAVIMLAEAVNAAFYAGDAEAMRHAAEQVRAVAPSNATGRTAFFSLMAQGMAGIFSGADEQGAELVREATALLDNSDELRSDPRLLAWAVMGPAWLREAHGGLKLVDRALEIARQQSAVGVLPFVLTHVAINELASDRWAAAQAGFHEAVDLARMTGQHTELTTSLVRLAGLEARKGLAEPSRQHAGEALELSRQLGLGMCEVWAFAALGELELALGHPEPALAFFEEQKAVLLARRIGDVDLSPGPELVELYLRSGRGDDARAAAQAYKRDATVKAQPWALARAARAQGLLATDDAEIDAGFEAALAFHAQTPDIFETARTHLLYGSQLRRARQRVRAREHLRTALDLFDRLTADPWSDMARGELAATGETARRRNPATLNQLTPQELQVALRIAEGRTTREAASALFLSPKTIEYHLRAVYRKLGIASRTELVKLLDQTLGNPAR
jgi:DNA-binding CsgD family transcriptional regulator